MNTIDIGCERPYQVRIGKGLLKEVGNLIGELEGIRRICVVTDDNVSRLYLDEVVGSLRDGGFKVCTHVFPSGERSKSMETYLSVMGTLINNDLQRKDALVALGGGVVGDLTGFVASTYMRGIRFIQIPTTILSAVDASVGGKTAVDFQDKKNLIGTFWQPSMVICDVETFDTLPEEIRKEGQGEVVKYAFIHDRKVLDSLTEGSEEEMVARCVEAKRHFVENDERDQGIRAALNFGHTVGHGYEYISGLTIRHGSAVMMGIICELYIGMLHGVTPEGLLDTALDCCRKLGLEGPRPFEPGSIFEAIRHDKKNNGGIGFVLITEMEKYTIEQIPESLCLDYLRELDSAIREGKLSP